MELGLRKRNKNLFSTYCHHSQCKQKTECQYNFKHDKNFVSKLVGEISLTSELGQGRVFTFYRSQLKRGNSLF